MFFIKGLFYLLHFPADITGEEPQNVDTVLFFTRLHKGIGQIVINVILTLIKSKLKFYVLSNLKNQLRGAKQPQATRESHVANFCVR